MKYLVNEHLVATFQHQFSLLAPNEEMALVMAQENFMRREPVVGYLGGKPFKYSWIRLQKKNRSYNRLDNKDYRNTKGYGYLKKKWRHYEQKMFDEKEILSWGKEKSK